MQLHLIRHPRPRDVTGLCYGRLDVSVDAETLLLTARNVRECISADVLNRSRIFSSPAARCVLLARELAAPREPQIALELQEMNFGSWEGQRWDAVPRDQLDAWARDVWHYKPGGAESASMVAARWQRWANLLGRSGQETAVVVTHAGVIRVALALAGAGPVSAAALWDAPISFGGVFTIDSAQASVPA